MRGASGAAAADVLASGERPRGSRLRLRRSRQRRAAASWDPSPVDPQATEYCLVASGRRAYSSLCAAHAGGAGRSRAFDALKAPQDDFTNDRPRKAHYKNIKYSRSTSIKDEDPVITCVGHKTHHMFDNLDTTKTYWVSVFGVGRGRLGGVLLAQGALAPHAAHARSLREGRARRADVHGLGGRALFTYKTSSGNTEGFWLGVVACRGPVDVQVSLRGRVVLRAKRIEQHARLQLPGAAAAAGAESADAALSASSVSGSAEQARARYLLKVSARGARPCLVEVVASERARGVPVPELGARDVRELSSARACDALVVAWWPARSASVHRYCIIARETPEGKAPEYCALDSRVSYNQVQRMICRDIEAKQDGKQILTQRIAGLQPGRRYSVLVTVSQDGGRAVAYDPLIVVTPHHCE